MHKNLNTMDKEIELKIEKVFESQTKPGVYGILLEEMGETKRQLPLVIGEKEAHAIHCALNNIVTTRPLTHDLMIACLDFAEVEILKALIYKMDVGIYYSYIYIKAKNEYTRIDPRTSDAIALAIRAEAPIYILESILQRECVEEMTKNDNSTSLFEQAEAEIEIRQKEKDLLQKKLEQAIDKEDYELASVLRDRIAEIE